MFYKKNREKREKNLGCQVFELHPNATWWLMILYFIHFKFLNIKFSLFKDSEKGLFPHHYAK